MSEDQTPTNPADDVVAVVEDLVERQRQILGALVAATHPLRNDVQAVLLGMRGVVTKLRNGAAEAVPTTPTTPDDERLSLHGLAMAAYAAAHDIEPHQVDTTDGSFNDVADVLRRYIEAGSSDLAVALGLPADTDDPEITEALEGLRAELAEAADALDKVAEERDAYRAEYIQMKHNWDAAREANNRLLSRPSVSDQTPATPDGPGFACVACAGSDLPHTCSRYRAPSSVQGDTTPGEGDQS